MSDYDQIPYVGMPIAAAHPWRLAWTSTVFGGPRPNLGRARVLEIGCGDGTTLLPIAAFEPTWTVLGIDASRRAIADAVSSARISGLTNATFLCADLASADIEPGAWDVVIAHGVYSWIDPERRAALRRLLRRALSRDGLAYVSFNALPGWSVRGRVRDLIVRDPTLHGGGRDILGQLAPYTGNDPWGMLLAKELRRAQTASEFYFAHEYRGPYNDAFWIGDFVQDAARDGLRWIGDSQFDLAEGRPYEQLRAALGTPGLRGEELADLVGYRQFRCAVLARDDAASQAPLSDDDAVRTAIVSGIVQPKNEPLDLGTSQEQTFRGADGIDIQVGEPLCKATLGVLANMHPDGLGFDDLIRASRQRLQEAGCAEISPRAESEVREGIARLWRVGVLQLRLHRPRLSVPRQWQPKVLAFAKNEALAKHYVTCALGESMAITPRDLIIIDLMDGTRTEAELIRDFVHARGTRDGGDPTILENAHESVHCTIAQFERWGLLDGTDQVTELP